MDNLQVIAIASGKGGVGKTMIAVAIATELSRAAKTLLLDLDFFNRGLTGLFASLIANSAQHEISPPKILTEEAPPSAEGVSKWAVTEVKRNLFMISYGDLDKATYDTLETMEVGALSRELSNYIKDVATRFECRFVVLDCHGGPDNSSFAACVLATHSILVSEPDRITLHGTLNFLRILNRHASQPIADIRLIFNKIVPAFSPLFLRRFYNQYLKAEFGGRDLLALYPLEIYLTKAFEKMPFLTAVYPQSQLAAKTKLVLHELFHNREGALPSEIQNMSRATRLFTQYYMGRWPTLLNSDFILKAIAIYISLLIGINLLLLNYLPTPLADAVATDPTGIANQIFLAMIAWLFLALSLNWTRELDVYIVYSIRARAFLAAVAGCVLLAGLWSFSLALVVAAILQILKAGFDFWQAVVIAVIAAIYGSYVVLFFIKGVRSLMFGAPYMEGLYRILFSAIGILGGVIALMVAQ